jgi:hypothetical protein
MTRNPGKSSAQDFGLVGEAPLAQSINRRYGINPLRMTGALARGEACRGRGAHRQHRQASSRSLPSDRRAARGGLAPNWVLRDPHGRPSAAYRVRRGTPQLHPSRHRGWRQAGPSLPTHRSLLAPPSSSSSSSSSPHIVQPSLPLRTGAQHRPLRLPRPGCRSIPAQLSGARLSASFAASPRLLQAPDDYTTTMISKAKQLDSAGAEQCAAFLATRIDANSVTIKIKALTLLKHLMDSVRVLDTRARAPGSEDASLAQYLLTSHANALRR